jgi:hypothetical protein
MDDQDGDRRAAKHFLHDAAQQDSLEAALSAGAHEKGEAS